MGYETGNGRLLKFAEAVRVMFKGYDKLYEFDGGVVLNIVEREKGYDKELRRYVIGPIGLLGMLGSELGLSSHFDIDGSNHRILYDRGDGVYEEYRRNGGSVETLKFMGVIGRLFEMIEDDVLGLFGVDVWGIGSGKVVSAPHREWNGHRLDIRLGMRYGWEEFVMNVEAYVEWRNRGERVGVVDNIFGGMGRVQMN